MAHNPKRGFAHCVYFKLNDDSPEAQEALVQGCHRYLSDHPGTLYYAAGRLADTHRTVNDRQFDVALVLVFQDRAAHDAYQAAPRHEEFIAEFRPNWRQVRVFDADVE